MSAATATIVAELEREGVLPVVTIGEGVDPIALGEGLLGIGIGCAEIALRTPGALAGIRSLSGSSLSGRMLIGAGTVLTPDQVDAVVDAGARFVVSPGLDDDVVARARELDVPVFPGVATATEVQRALRAGLTHLKLFPAGPLGGPAMLRALGGPFPDVRFMPSGGVTAQNAADYRAVPTVFTVSGSWMLPGTASR